MESVDDVLSVGGAYQRGDVYSVEHPLYRAFADAVAERVQDVGVERGRMRASTRPVLLGVALQPEESVALADAFPEFTVSVSGRVRPGHAYLVAYRRVANEWLMEQADKYSTSVAHLGGSLASYLVAGAGTDVKLLYDLTDPVAVHEKYSTSMEAHGYFENYMATSHALGRMVDHRAYDNYLRGEGVRFHTKMAAMPGCDVLLLDLTVCDYSPMQVACMMKQSGAKLSFGFFLYHPAMLFEEEGELGETGVHFQRRGSHMTFRYPEGVAGVTDMGAHTWDSWLVAHTFKLGKGAGASWYQLELLKNRGHLMFFRVTALAGEPVEKRVCHALDVSRDDSYVLSLWRMRRFGADPRESSSWQRSSVLVEKRVLDRLYQFAMQLPREQFTRYALRKQVSVINDRVTVEGTMVRVNKPMPVETVDALVVAVFSRAFVDRYETSQLTAEAMKAVRDAVAFSAASRMGKVGYVMWWCLQSVYDRTLGTLGELVGDLSDAVRDAVSSGLPFMAVDIEEVPPYILLSDAARGCVMPSGVAELVAMENSRRASEGSRGFAAKWSRAFSSLTDTCSAEVYSRYRVEEVNLATAAKAVGPAADAAVAVVRQEVALDEPRVSRSVIEATSVVRRVREGLRVDFDPVADPVEIFNRLHSAAFPGVAEQALEYDTASISFDPQDRMLTASRLVLPRYMGEGPVSRSYYKSKVRALNVPKRQQTVQELLSAVAARNLNAPQVSVPQDEDTMVRDVWGTFLDKACVPDARRKLVEYQADPASLSEDSFREWAMQSDPQKLEALRRELEEAALSFSEMSVADYLVMLKADVKPPLSSKPLTQRTEPQVIVYHRKALSGLFSSVFRVLVRRFLSLLQPEYHVNLLKDTVDLEAFLRAVHPYGRKGLMYLENDFSKYDKSQGRFVYLLETYMFEQLGMNLDMLQKWCGGHIKSKMRAVAMAFSLEVYFQRKSGDGTTSFGNVALNVLSTTYAYKAVKVVWAVYMGDDSLICCEVVMPDSEAVAVLAEVFNLGAKMFITKSPYFVSNFVMIDEAARDVALVADPVKRIERWSMSVSADDPQWKERYVSACDALKSYLDCASSSALPKALL